MKLVEFSLPYFDSFRPIKGENEYTLHPFAKYYSEFLWRTSQLRMFLDEIERHTRKMDKRVTMKIFGFKLIVPAIGIDASTKKSLIRNRQEVERMISDSIIVILISVLEYSLRDFCTALRTSKRLKLSWDELRGGPLDRFKTYYEKVGEQELVISNEDWEDLKAIDRLRNTIAHSMGVIRDEDKYQLERLAKKHQGLEISNGCVFPSLGFAREIIDLVNMAFSQCMGKFVQPEIEDILRRAKGT